MWLKPLSDYHSEVCYWMFIVLTCESWGQGISYPTHNTQECHKGKQTERAGKMALRLRALAPLKEDPSLSPSPYVTTACN